MLSYKQLLGSLAILALSETANAQQSRPDTSSKYKSTRVETHTGVAKGDTCQIQVKGKMPRGVRAIGGSQISDPRFHDGVCDVDFLTGELTDAAEAEERSRTEHMAKSAQQSTKKTKP